MPMSDLTEHLRKAGKVKTEKKTLASRATIVGAREAKPKWKELRARYVAALEGLAAKVKAAKLPRTIHNSGIHAAATTVEQIANEIGGRK